jgi:predicted PurR-regulated permease PerM
MEIKNFNTTYLIWLLLLAGAGVVILFLPFATAMIIAGVLATLFYKPYQRMAKFIGKSWSAFVSCLLILLLIIIPFLLTAGLVTKEIRGALKYFSENPEMIQEGVTYINALIQDIPFVDSLELSSFFNKGGELGLSFLQKTYTGVSAFFFWLFIMFFSLFYFLLDGKRVVEYVMHLSPLKNHQERVLIKEFMSISRATLKGTVVVGIIQGTLGGLLFWAVGVPSPITWGVIMIILSIIPVVGSGLVWTPVGVAMLFSGNIWQGLVILGFGFGVISTIDNILRPKLVGRDSQMHPLLVLLATLGGIILFGVIGFILGPILVSLFLALVRIYEKEFSQQLRSYNESISHTDI